MSKNRVVSGRILVASILLGGGTVAFPLSADPLGDELLGAVDAGAAWRTGKADVASVIDAPDPFSPATADGREDQVQIDSSGSALLPNNKKKVEYAVAVYHVVSRDGVAVWRQAELVPLSFPAGARPGTPAPVANATTWDGRDDEGVIVPGGTYDVRVIYALLGRKTSGATAPWPTGDALVQGFVDTVLGGGPSGDDGGVFSGYGADGVKLFGFDDGATDVTVDDGPPVIQLRRPMDGDVILFSPVSVVGRVVDASGVAHVWVNGLEIAAPAGRFQTNVDLEPGINVIDVLAEDVTGNRSSLSITVTFAPDTTGPEIVIEYPLPGDELLEAPVDVIGTVFDPSGVTAVFVNAVAAQVVGGEFFATAELRPGPNTIVVTAHDGWDNLSEVSVVVNLAETAPPPSPADGSVHGTVFDDATGAPLAGARVTCAELGVWAVAASDGTFTLAVPTVDTPNPGPLDADGWRELQIDIRADRYLNAVRTAVVPEHPRGYEVAVEPVYLAVQDPHVSVIGPAGGVATNGDGTVVVEFPPGALDRMVEFRLTSYPSARSTVAPLPPRMVAIYPVDFYPDGLELAQPIVDHLANTDGLAPGTELRCIRFQDGRWVEGGSARISDDGAWLDYETRHTSSHFPATTVSDPLPPVVQPDDGCTGADCATACEDREQGQSSVSRRSGELQESIVVGPAGRENGDGLSPWPLRLQYSSATVRPHALLEVRAWFPPDVTGWDRLKSMFRVDVLGSGRTYELEYTPAASGLAGPPGRLRYLFDGRRSSGAILETGIYPASVAVGSQYWGPTEPIGGVYLPAHLVNSWTPDWRQVTVRNEVDSPFGAGWGLAGLKRLVRDPGGLNWSVFDPGGEAQRFYFAGAGEVVTVAGTTGGVYWGSGRRARDTTLPEPSGLAVDGAGRTFIVHSAGYPLYQVLSVVHSDGVLYTLLPPNGVADARPGRSLPSTAGPLAFFGSTATTIEFLVGSNDGLFRVTCTSDSAAPAGLDCQSTLFAGGGTLSPPTDPASDGLVARDVRLMLRAGGIWVSPSGETFVLRQGDRFVWRIDNGGTDGVRRIWRFAGLAGGAPACDSQPSPVAPLNAPLWDLYAVTGDAAENIYVSSVYCPAIWKVDHTTGLMTRILGTGLDEWTPDGELPAGNATCRVRSIAVSGGGELHFVTECTNSSFQRCQVVRKVGADGRLATVLGDPWYSPTSPSFGDGVDGVGVLTAGVSALAFDASGSLYYAESTWIPSMHAPESSWNRVRKVVGAGGDLRSAGGTFSELLEWTSVGETWHTVRRPGGVLDHFDPSGRLVKTWAPDDSAFGYQYVFEYDPVNGRLASVLDDAGRRAYFSYAAGKLDHITDFSGAPTEFEIDAAGNLASVERSGFSDTRRAFTYDSDHLLRTQTTRQATGDRTSTYWYDDDGMVTRVDVGTETRRTISAADGVALANDMGYEPGEPEPSVPREWASPPGGFPFVGTVTDEHGTTLEYAFGGARTSGGWRTASTPSTPAGYAYDVAGASDANRLVTGFSYYTTGGSAADRLRSYDSLGRLVEEHLPSIGGDPYYETSYRYDDLCDRPTLKTTTEWPGGAALQEQWTYDAQCRLATHSEPSGRFTRYIYDPLTRLLAEERDAAGRVVRSYTHDALGRLGTVTDADGRAVTYSYSAADLVEQEVEEGRLGTIRTTTSHYDALGRLEWFETSPGVRSEYVYYDETLSGCCGGTSRGPDEVIDPDGNTTLYEHDADGRVTLVTNAETGVATEYRYAGADPRVSEVILHDAAGAAVRTTAYTYDWRGRLLSVAAGGGTTTYAYPVDRSDAAVSLVTDAERRPSSYTWGLASRAWRGQLTSATLPDSGTDSYSYDGLGRLTRQVRATGRATRFRYDGAGRPWYVWHDLSFAIGIPDWWVSFDYEPDGGPLREVGEHLPSGALRARTTFHHDVMERVDVETREQRGRDYVVQYAYDDLGAIETAVYPSGMVVIYRRELADPDQISSVIAFPPTGVWTTLAQNVSYTDAGLLTGYAMGNGMTYGITRGPRGRVEHITAIGADPPADVLDLQYSYLDPATGYDDPTGNIRAIYDAVDARNADYGYDEADRLIAATGWWGTLAWTYDRTGNRLSETRRDHGSTTDEVSTYSYQDENLAGPDPTRPNSRLVQVTGADPHVLAYDLSGNATRYDNLCLRYDGADRLTQIRRLADPAGSCIDCASDVCAPQVVQENTYDYKFRRTERVEWVDAAGNPLPPASRPCTAFIYDLSDRLIAEHDCSSGSDPDAPDNVLAEYVYLDGYHVLAVRRGGAWYWYLNDHLATPKKLVDASRNVVWDGKMRPFGDTEEAVAAVEQPLRFPGQHADRSSALVYNHHRFLAGALGRYLAIDPRLWSPGTRPTAVQPYAYALARPLREIDPSGADIVWEGVCGDLEDDVERAIDRQARRDYGEQCENTGNLKLLKDAAPDDWTVTITCLKTPLPGCSGCGGYNGACGAPYGEHIVVTFAGSCARCLARTVIHELLHAVGVADEDWARYYAECWIEPLGLPADCHTLPPDFLL